LHATRKAEAIAAGMVRKRAALQKMFQTNCASLAKDLKALDQEIQTIVSKNPSMP
jgi:ABC-type Zn uptake system ZnuABC Zn-binding protein ZnuA